MQVQRWWMMPVMPAMVVAACSDRAVQVAAPQAVTVATTTTNERAMAAANPGETNMDDLIRNQLARTWSVAADTITVRYPLMIDIPGARLFHARAGAPAERGGHEFNGLATASGLLTGAEAHKAIAAAWNYGANRTVPARDVAQALAHVFDARNQSGTIATELALRSFRRVVNPATADAAILPEEVEIDGRPAVRFVLQSSARAFKPSLATAIFHADGAVELRLSPLP